MHRQAFKDSANDSSVHGSCRASSEVNWGEPCLQEGESLQYAPVSVRHFLVHDLVQYGDTHAQQYEWLLRRMAVCMEALIKRQAVVALHCSY